MVKNKDLVSSIVIANISFLVLYIFHTIKKFYKLKKSTNIYNIDINELRKYDINSYIYTLIENRKFKDNYFKHCIMLSDIYIFPQSKIVGDNYRKKVMNQDKNKYDNKNYICIRVNKYCKILDKIKTFLYLNKNKIGRDIHDRKSNSFILPKVVFSKKNLLPVIIEEEILRELNKFVAKSYSKPNKQLNSFINISKAIEYFIVKGVSFSSLRVNWANNRFLSLLEKIGSSMLNQNFNISINVKEYDVSYFCLNIKYKSPFYERGINELDELVAKQLIKYFEKNAITNVQIATKDPSLSLASPYAKLILKTIPKDIHKILSCHITANKNGISYSVLKNHPDLELFLTKNFIHRYLYIYCHSIKIDTTQNPEKIFIKYKGHMEEWKSIKDKINYRDDKVSMIGRYTQDGIVDDDVFNWTELKSFINRNKKEETVMMPNEKALKQQQSTIEYSSSTDDDSTIINSNENESDEFEEMTANSENEVESIDTINIQDSKQLFNVLTGKIESYKAKYKVFSDIHKETFINNTKETIEKFLYHDTQIKNRQDPYEHNWGNRYILEYCFWIVSQPRLSGDHAFIKLKTPEGNVYSVGLYREFKNSLFDSFIFPLRIKPCKFLSPDLSEFWKGYYDTIQIEITKEQFEKIKSKIEADQKMVQYRPYQHINSNCVTWTQEIAAMANVYFPCDYPMTKLLFKSSTIQNISRKIFKSKILLPYTVVIHKIWAIIINFLSILLGARRIDERVKKNDYYKIESFYTSIRDLADINKVILMHPFIMGYYVFNYIHSWRYEQVIQLESELKEIMSVIKSKELLKQISQTNGEFIKAMDNEMEQYQKRMKEIEKDLDDIPYRIPERFRRKQELPEGELYTQCPLKYDEE